MHFKSTQIMQTQPVSNQENPFVSDEEDNLKNSKPKPIRKEKFNINESQNKADSSFLFAQNEDTSIPKRQQLKSEIYEIPKERKTKNLSILEQQNAKESRDLLILAGKVIKTFGKINSFIREFRKYK